MVVDGAKSEYSRVTSGVPQGSVLGPVLFLMYINDIGSNLTSTVKLFADDCLIYRAIRSVQDVTRLQDDLDSLMCWVAKWHLT